VRVLTSSVLTFEIILIGLLVPTVLAFDGKNQNVLIALAASTALLAVFAMGLMKKPIGLFLGWVVQVLLFVMGGFVGPAFFIGVVWILAAIFTILWILAIRLGRKADIQKARYSQGLGTE
jgi:hypothetical protein